MPAEVVKENDAGHGTTYFVVIKQFAGEPALLESLGGEETSVAERNGYVARFVATRLSMFLPARRVPSDS